MKINHPPTPFEGQLPSKCANGIHANNYGLSSP